MEIALWTAAYLALSFVVCVKVGTAAKQYRADGLGISLEEDSRLQDEAQLHYIRTGESINVID